jgi:uncharacterized membrane protein
MGLKRLKKTKAKTNARMKRKKKYTKPKTATYDTYDSESSKGDRFSDAITTILFLGTWLVLSTVITLWITDMGLHIFLAVILGIVGGFIANVLAWLIFRSGFTPMM